MAGVCSSLEKRALPPPGRFTKRDPAERTPKQITDMPGGAMDPALIATGDLVFSSPVPKASVRAGSLRVPPRFTHSRLGDRRAA